MDSKPSNDQRGRPPPISLRDNSQSESPYDDAPPPYEAIADNSANVADQMGVGDPRSSSTQSLVPSESNQQNERRKLLLVYLHGFMGNETSFRSFPAHVHNLLTVLLAESHVVHTKIYPRYRSKRNISFARDDFSRWLEPHDLPDTDVVLLGHSMGGLLGAEVVLMPPALPASRAFKHRLLGTINFDVPFLGMHPGVVKSGLASIFAAPEQPGDKYDEDGNLIGSLISNGGAGSSASPSGVQSPNRTDTLWTPENPDPNFNPSFQNDVVLPVRKGWRNAWHFLNKHGSSASELGKATKQLVTSHLEFGGAMANYGELKTRYVRVRALEEEDEAVRKSVAKGAGDAPRVRFINYYTASTGRKKKPKSVDGSPEAMRSESRTSLDTREAAVASRSRSPRISLEEYQDDGGVIDKPVSDEDDDLPMMSNLDPQAMSDSEAHSGVEDLEAASKSLTIGQVDSSEPLSGTTTRTNTEDMSRTSSLALSPSASLPPVPDLPPKPSALDVSYITDKETRKLVEKEHDRAVKAYEKAVKDREKIIRDRAKLEEKRERKSQKGAEKSNRNAHKTRDRVEKDALNAQERSDAKAFKASEKSSRAERKEATRELTHAESEAKRMAQEKLRMENEGRRMRGEPPLTELPGEDSANTTMTGAAVSLSSARSSSPSPSPTPPPLASPASTSNNNFLSLSTSRTSTTHSTQPSTHKSKSKSKHKDAAAPPKDRMFCSLPPKDANGERDPCWVRVYMENVDEVGAHCGLFFVDERYQRLVGDVAERIEGWVMEDRGSRAARSISSGGEGGGKGGSGSWT